MTITSVKLKYLRASEKLMQKFVILIFHLINIRLIYISFTRYIHKKTSIMKKLR